MEFLDLNGLKTFKEDIYKEKGKENGFASLDKNGKVPSSQLPLTKKIVPFSKVVEQVTITTASSTSEAVDGIVYAENTKTFIAYKNKTSGVITSKVYHTNWANTNEDETYLYPPATEYTDEDLTFNGAKPSENILYYNEEEDIIYEWRNSDLLPLTDATMDGSVVKHVYFNMNASNDLTHDITVENNSLGLFFNSPLKALYISKTIHNEAIQTIGVTMPAASTSANGYMSSTDKSRLDSLYSSHYDKTYLQTSGGTVSGFTTFEKGLKVEYSPLEVTGEGIEIYHATPFIDFHYGKSSKDYTSRIIESSSGVLNINGFTINISTGNGVFKGTVTATQHVTSSDERLKENINPISDDVSKIGQIEFKEFNYKNDDNKTKSYGVIAQDLEKAGLDNLVVEDEKGYKAVDYTALLVLELQRLRNEVKELRAKYYGNN